MKLSVQREGGEPGLLAPTRVLVISRFRSQSIRPSPSHLRLYARLLRRTLLYCFVNFAIRTRSQKLLPVTICRLAIGTCDCGVELLPIMRLQLECNLEIGRIGGKWIDLARLSHMLHSLGGLALHRQGSPEIVLCGGISRV